MHIRSVAVALIGLAAACAPSSGSAESYLVEIRGMEFTPRVLDVAVGDTITWINRDVVPHTATAQDGSWDSGSLEQGGEWSLVVETSGPADYVCTFHPQMTGAINAR